MEGAGGASPSRIVAAKPAHREGQRRRASLTNGASNFVAFTSINSTATLIKAAAILLWLRADRQTENFQRAKLEDTELELSLFLDFGHLPGRPSCYLCVCWQTFFFIFDLLFCLFVYVNNRKHVTFARE